MVDFSWLYEMYHMGDDPLSHHVHEHFRRYFKLEDFIHLCLEDLKMEFVDERTQPEVEANVLTPEQETRLYKFVEMLFTNIHLRLEETLDHDEKVIPTADNKNVYNLVGFFGTTAIIGIGENVDYKRYPTFEESYGSFGNEVWRTKIVNNPVLQTVAPIINGECAPFRTF